MRRAGLLVVGIALLAAASSLRADRVPAQADRGTATPSPVSTSTPPQTPASPAASVAADTANAAADSALVQKYCVTCHNTRAKTGGLSLDGMNPADAAAHAELWEKIVMKLR